MCRCLPSYPGTNATKKPDYNVWICISKVTCRVHSAYCDCPAGRGESCNHVAALMIALIDISKKQLEGKLAPTSIACSWKKPRQRNLSPKKSVDIQFSGRSKHLNSSKSNASSFSMARTVQTSKPLSEKEFLAKYTPFQVRLNENGTNAAWPKNFVTEDTCTSENSKGVIEPVPDMHCVDRMFGDWVDLNGDQCRSFFSSYYENLRVTLEECIRIYDTTMSQSAKDEWFRARFGRLTSSAFGSIFRRKQCTPPDNLLKYILQYVVPYQGKSVQHGMQYEQKARDNYLLIIRETHPSLTVSESGFIVDSKYPHLGTSPDGLAKCAHCELQDGLLEIKCPWAHRSVHPREAALSDNFYCKLTKNGTLRLDRTHKYYYQVLGQMGIYGRRWCDFVVWTFKGISVERISFDENLRKDMLVKLEGFYLSSVLPELFTERVKRGRSLFPACK